MELVLKLVLPAVQFKDRMLFHIRELTNSKI